MAQKCLIYVSSPFSTLGGFASASCFNADNGNYSHLGGYGTSWLKTPISTNDFESNVVKIRASPSRWELARVGGSRIQLWQRGAAGHGGSGPTSPILPQMGQKESKSHLTSDGSAPESAGVWFRGHVCSLPRSNDVEGD